MANAICRSNRREDAPDPLRLDPYEKSQTIMAGPRSLDLDRNRVLPNGVELAKTDPYVNYSKMRLKVSPYYAAKTAAWSVTYPKSFEWISTIQDPLTVAAIAKTPCVYWSTIEHPKSWTYARVFAFSSTSASAEAQSIVICAPITGAAVNVAAKYRTA